MEGVSRDGPFQANSEDAVLVDAANRVLQAGIHLVQYGFGRLGLLPYLGGAGYWRCEFHVLGHPERVLYRYSSGAGFRFLADHAGGLVPRAVTPRALARAIMVSVPEHLQEQCRGEADARYLEWLLDFRAHLERLPCVPVAFHEYAEDKTHWELRRLGSLHAPSARIAPPPGYVYPGEEPSAEDDPFWRERIKEWRLLALKPAVTVPIESLDDSPVVADIAGRLCQELQGSTVEAAAEPFRRALKAAVVASRAGLIDPQKLLWALREAGLEPNLVRVEDGQLLVGLSLAGAVQELGEEEFEMERTNRLFMACGLLGLHFEGAASLIDDMCRGPLVQALLIERQHEKFSAQKLTAKAIKKAKRD